MREKIKIQIIVAIAYIVAVYARYDSRFTEHMILLLQPLYTSPALW